MNRISDQQRTPESADEEDARKDRGTSEQHGGDGGSVADISEMHTPSRQPVGLRNKTRSSSIQLGVMRPGSQAREYDLIPGTVDPFSLHLFITKEFFYTYIVPQNFFHFLE